MAKPANARHIMEYMRGNADRPIPIEEVGRELDMLPSGVSTVLSRMVKDDELPNIVRVQRGVFKWKSDAHLNERDVIHVTFVRETNSGVLVDWNGELFVMKALGI